MSAGLAAIQQLQKPEIYANLEQKSHFFTTELLKAATKYNIPLTTCSVGGLFGFAFTDDHDNTIFKKFFHQMLHKGVYFAPSPFESGFISLAHEESVLTETISLCAQVFATL